MKARDLTRLVKKLGSDTVSAVAIARLVLLTVLLDTRQASTTGDDRG
jgi:hypothetical protein